jgi:nucleoside 2-deoxyribosyltransferase
MEDTNPKAFVFVLMPFGEDFRDVYEVGIKTACKDAGAYCERVDEQIFVESILERVYNQIAKADLIVAEMTGRNPNVFYEVGYAHALNKQVVLLTQNSEDIPFDLKHYPHIIYGGRIAALKSQLETRVRWCIENPREFLTKVDWRLEFLVNRRPLQGTRE